MGIDRMRDWLRGAPPGTTILAAALLDLLEEDGADAAPVTPAAGLELRPEDLTWRERLWIVPAETRLGTREVLEAMGRSRSWLYGQLGEEREGTRLPHRKLDGELVFTAGEIRTWIRDREEVLHALPMESTSTDRKLQVLDGGSR